MIQPSIYLDHQASTPLSCAALEAMRPWLEGKPSNPHATSNPAGRAGHAAIETARAQVADLVGAEPENVIFTSGATEAANIVLRSLGRPGTHIVTSAIEHACVAATVADLVRLGVRATVVGVDEAGLVDLDEVGSALQDGGDLVSIMAVNNEVGTIQPIREIANMAQSAGAMFHTDAAQAVGRIPLDLRRQGIDLLTLSGHKLYGPQGIGAIVGTRDALARLRPVTTGGGQELGLRPGTLPIALCAGLGAACCEAAVRMDADTAHARTLSKRFLATLCTEIPDLGVNGDVDARVPQNLNLLIPGCDADDLVRRLTGVTISSGSACSSGALGSSPVLRAMGLSAAEADASIRIGFGRGNTEAEVVRAAQDIARAVAEAGRDEGRQNVERVG